MIYWWSIDHLSIYRWYIDDLPMIEPCFGMNGHPRARINTILRHCEAPIKIYNLQASQHRFIGLNGRLWLAKGQIWKTCPKHVFLLTLFLNLISIQGIQGTIPDGLEPILELKNTLICNSFNNSIFLTFFFWSGGPGGLSGSPGDRLGTEFCPIYIIICRKP